MGLHRLERKKRIEGFQGEYRWLSNFWPVTIQINSHIFPSTENAYQALKFHNHTRYLFEKCSPGDAKKMARLISNIQRPDWDSIKINTMIMVNEFKYGQNPELCEKLLNTGDAYIEETNKWGDTFWGVSKGIGENNLGKILMGIRDQLRTVEGVTTLNKRIEFNRKNYSV